MTATPKPRRDALERFIEHIACSYTGADSGEALLFTRRIPAGFVPIRENLQLTSEDRGNIVMALIRKHNTGTLEKNKLYSMPVLIEEGERATEDFVQKILHDEKFIHKLADVIANAMRQRDQGVPA